MNRTDGYIASLLTDQYELTMACAHFCAGKHEDKAVFDLFFRKNPFGGEFTIYAGLSEALRFVENYGFSEEDIDFLKSVLPRWDPGFEKWLKSLDCSQVKIYAAPEGSVVFPNEPLLRVEGPLGICQLLETALLNLTSFPSLVATNAARMKLAAGREKKIVEFGLRRAQGPNGGMSASRYSYLGGVDSTSNLMAGQAFGIPVRGTHAHAFISSYSSLDELQTQKLTDEDGNEYNLVEMVLKARKEFGYNHTHAGELTSFIAYAQAFPQNFLALVDTYDTLESGIPNFLCVAAALARIGYEPAGIRLDSGDLAHLSKEARRMFEKAAAKMGLDFGDLKIVASNEINESTLWSLRHQEHNIDIFGISTHLVTCQSQPSLGCVYKLVEINGRPRIKLSQETTKVTIPGRKDVYRLIGKEDFPLVDIMYQVSSKGPEVGERVLCRHPFESRKRMYVTPSKIVSLLELWFDGKIVKDVPSLSDSRRLAAHQLENLRPDHLRMVNPTPYKVSLSKDLYRFMHKLWEHEASPGEIS